MRFSLGSLLFGVVSVVYSLGAAAQTVTLPVTQDTWISGLGSTTVHGGELALGLCPGASYWTYLKFDLSGLAGDVVSAELRMTRVNGARPEEISVFLIQGDSWTEANLTGPTRPVPTDPPNSSQLATGEFTGGGYDRWLSTALTAAVRQEALGDQVLSLMVRENFVNMIDIRYYRSREAAVPSGNKPQLVVTLAPAEVSGLVLDDSVPAVLRWSAQGAGITYDIVTGSFSGLRAGGGATSASCLADGVTTNTYDDHRANPPAGDGDYYLLRGQSACCPGTYGFASSGTERTPSAACP